MHNHFKVYPSKNRSNIISNTSNRRTHNIYAAEGDFDIDMNDVNNANDSFSDQVDDIADNIEDIKDSIDDISEDDIDIDVDNNISGHYIAECDRCKGIFISATVKSDQSVSSVSGICPLCQEESEQYLKWYIVPNTDESDDEETIKPSNNSSEKQNERPEPKNDMNSEESSENL